MSLENSPLDEDRIEDINRLAAFLAIGDSSSPPSFYSSSTSNLDFNDESSSIGDSPSSSSSSSTALRLQETVYILAGNAVLPTIRALFQHISDLPRRETTADPTSDNDGKEAKSRYLTTLLICGGIGHSTELLLEALLDNFEFPPEAMNQLRPRPQSRRQPNAEPGPSGSAIPTTSTTKTTTTAMNAFRLIPESRMLEILLHNHFPTLSHRVGPQGDIQLLIEDQSTNCGANAVESVKLLEKEGMCPERIVVVQDPTMMRRTIAGFEKIYQGWKREGEQGGSLSAGREGLQEGQDLVGHGVSSSSRGVVEGSRQARKQRRRPTIRPWSTFTPRLKQRRTQPTSENDASDDMKGLQWDIEVVQTTITPGLGLSMSASASASASFAIAAKEVWSHQRFFDLIMGEIPRLRDDKEGYGPNGKGFIAHVDIPSEVLGSWERLSGVLQYGR